MKMIGNGDELPPSQVLLRAGTTLNEGLPLLVESAEVMKLALVAMATAFIIGVAILAVRK